MTTAAEVRRRERIAVPLFIAMYLGVPLVLLALAIIVAQRHSAQYGGGFDWVQIIPSTIMLAAGAFLVRDRRYELAKWPRGGAIFGATGGFLVFGLIVLQAITVDGGFFDELISWFAGAVPIFGGLCWVLGRSARHVLTYPVVAELADSRYEWTFPVRAAGWARSVAVGVDLRNLSILETYTVHSPDSSTTSTRGEWIPLARLSEVGAVTIDGRTRPRLPSAIECPADTEPGPALVIPRGKGRLVVPVDKAEPIAQLIQRRITLARTG